MRSSGPSTRIIRAANRAMPIISAEAANDGSCSKLGKFAFAKPTGEASPQSPVATSIKGSATQNRRTKTFADVVCGTDRSAMRSMLPVSVPLLTAVLEGSTE